VTDMSQPAQSFENHAKMVPLYHYVTTPLLLLPTLYFVYRTVTDFSLDRLAWAALAVGLLLAALFARVFPLGVQDRVIRLEEQLRLQRILPEPVRSRALELTTRQLIALRFASDEEVPDLVARILDGGLADGKDIKRAVRTWRADHQRI